MRVLRKACRLIFFSCFLALFFLSANALYAKDSSRLFSAEEDNEGEEDSNLKIRKKFPSFRVYYDFDQVIKEVKEEVEAESQGGSEAGAPSKK